IFARSTRPAGSVRERATAPNVAKSSSPIANSIACRHPAMTSVLVPESSSEATSHVSKNESSAYDRFHRIDELGWALLGFGAIPPFRHLALVSAAAAPYRSCG